MSADSTPGPPATTAGQPGALYYDDVVVGTEVTSLARTVGETEIVLFAGLSGDYNPLHVDAEAGRTGPHGGRIGHGLLGAAISSGLFTRTAFSLALQHSLVAMLHVDLRFVSPLRIGDTVHVVATVSDKRPTGDSSRGIVVLERELRNQRDDVVQVMRTTMLLGRRPAG